MTFVVGDRILCCPKFHAEVDRHWSGMLQVQSRPAIKRTGRNGEPQSLSSSHSPRVVSYELSHAEPASTASDFGSVRFTQGSIILGKTLGIRYFAY